MDHNPVLDARFFARLALASPRKRTRGRLLLRCLPPIGEADACLDLGTGTGAIAVQFAHRGRWTFVERDREASQLSRHLLSGSFENADALAFLQTAPRYQLITCLDAIQYFDRDLQKVARTIAAHLEPGGYFLVSGLTRSRGLLSAIRRRLGIEAGHAQIVNPDEHALAAVLRETGFSVERTAYYCGPASLALQTVLDTLALRKQAGAEGDRVTLKASSLPRATPSKNLARLILSAAATVACWLDPFFPFAHSHGYLLVARRKSV